MIERESYLNKGSLYKDTFKDVNPSMELLNDKSFNEPCMPIRDPNDSFSSVHNIMDKIQPEDNHV